MAGRYQVYLARIQVSFLDEGIQYMYMYVLIQVFVECWQGPLMGNQRLNRALIHRQRELLQLQEIGCEDGHINGHDSASVATCTLSRIIYGRANAACTELAAAQFY